MSAFDTESASRILYALGQVAKEQELSAIILPYLQNAFVACLGTLAESLLTRGHTDCEEKEVEAVCRLLARLLDGPESRGIPESLRGHCADAVSKILLWHPTHHEVQVNAQWALAQLVGIQQTLRVVQPLFSNSPIAVSAFLWTATDTEDELDWESQKVLLVEAVQILANRERPADIDVQRRCFDLIARRLSADAALGSPSDEMERRTLAADSVHALLHGMTYALNSNEPKAATQAAEALWKVCRGASDEPVCNPMAQRRLQLPENEQQVVFLVSQSHSKKSDDLQRCLIDVLAIVKGLPCLVNLLVCPTSTDYLKWSVLKAIERLQGFEAPEAAIAVHRILSAVGPEPKSDLLQQAVRALAELIEGIQAQMMNTVLSDSSEIAVAVRRGAEAVLGFLTQFQEGRDGRWPAKSARMLRAAAFVDATSKDALSKSEKLKTAAMQRISGACQRNDCNTYPELEGTFALALTVWGVSYALDVLREALSKPHDLHRGARHTLIQVMCRVLTGTQDELEANDAMAVIKVMLEAKEQLQIIQEQSSETFGPMAAALGHAMGALEGDSGLLQIDGAGETLDKAAEAQAFFLHWTLQWDNLSLTQEVCWGVCAASSARGGIQLKPLAKAGVISRLEAVVEKLVQQAHRDAHKQRAWDETAALSEALEALHRLRGGGFVPMLNLMRQCANVKALQIAALRAMTNMIDDRVRPSSPEEVLSLAETCREALMQYGDQDERVRTSAERILGQCEWFVQ